MTTDTLEQQIAVLRQEVLRLDHAWQLAHGTGNYAAIAAAEAAYELAHTRLGRLVKRKLEVRRG